MDRNTENEIASIVSELQSIINELEDISFGIKKDFMGIGNEKCATIISNEANKYKEVKRKIEKIDTSKIMPETTSSGRF